MLKFIKNIEIQSYVTGIDSIIHLICTKCEINIISDEVWDNDLISLEKAVDIALSHYTKFHSAE